MTCLPPLPTPNFFKWRDTNANTGEEEVEKVLFPSLLSFGTCLPSQDYELMMKFVPILQIN